MSTKAASKKPGQRPKALKQDDSIMGTNNSSIVSKRSVERLYYPDEPHFFRYFVKKPQRRAPLINRGYWLRMKAVDSVVQKFLEEQSTKTKIVVNLGAGYDPLPWQCLTRYPKACQGVKFVDIDYPDLMLRKRSTIMATPELQALLTNMSSSDGDILFKSDQYLQLGCDLRKTSELEKIMSSIIDIRECLILFTAEVSVTYMTTQGADALIKYAASLPDARFCLLEQILPQGRSHPFAQTMMAHFDKLQTSLHSIERYPTLKHQERRFKDAGWASAKAQNLWQLWSSETFLSPEVRQAVDAVEPFDEWEEFALFGTHYFLLVADSSKAFGDHDVSLSDMLKSEISTSGLKLPPKLPDTPRSVTPTSESDEIGVRFAKTSVQRRFGSILSVRSTDTTTDFVGNFAGIGQSRVNSTDLYTSDPSLDVHKGIIPAVVPSPRMLHTTTDLGDTAILIGGRTSPDNALSDCYVWSKWTSTWEQIDDFPVSIYRHSAIHLGDGKVLVMGGKQASSAYLSEAWLWSQRTSWLKCTSVMPTQACVFPRRFGASLVLVDKNAYRGLWFGGINTKGLICQDSWLWEMAFVNDIPTIRFSSCDLSEALPEPALLRFGASIAMHDNKTVMVGGVTGDQLLPHEREILLLEFQGSRQSAMIDDSYTPLSIHMHVRIRAVHVHIAQGIPRPLFIGSSAILIDDDLVVVGGGAVCFSMGTFWNEGVYTLSTSDNLEVNSPKPWQFLKTTQSERNTSATKQFLLDPISAVTETIRVPRQSISSSEEFSKLVVSAKPIVLEKQDLGPCCRLWTDDYLTERIGPEREVVIHESTSEHMDFLQKNFQYTKKSFRDFLQAAIAGQRLYLRSLSSNRPSEEPANIANDFPSIASDFHLPAELVMVSINAHSSPLRISGPVNMWLHYDVMANVLCQIRGTKTLLLFPPADVIALDFAPGNSSNSIDVFALHAEGKLKNCHPHEVLLTPGDILFIPPLWLHAAKPLDGLSIGVNVFFRNLEKGYAAGRDVYGNRDLGAYEKGRLDVARIAKAFSGISPDMKEFYLLRLAEELRVAAASSGA